MEIKTRFVLKHQNGPYLSWDREQFPHTWKLSNARRFYKIEEISDFLSNSYYKPENPDEYEVIEIEIEYRLKEADGNERMQTSIHAGMDGRTEIAHEDG